MVDNLKLGIKPLCSYLLHKYKVKINYKINLNKITISIKLNNTRKNIAHYTLFHVKCAHIFRKVAGGKKKKNYRKLFTKCPLNDIK